MRSPIFPIVGSHVDGLTVGDHIPNTESIAATLGDYTVWAGVREVPLDAFDTTDPRDLFYAADDLRRCSNLADLIEHSARIDPLIVVLDRDGLYVLEGAHRLGALHILKRHTLPALVVMDDDPETGYKPPR